MEGENIVSEEIHGCLLRPLRWLLAAAACWLCLETLGISQDESAATPQGSPQQVEFGMVLKASGGGFKNVVGTVTVPGDWPNQQRVRVVKDDLPPGAVVNYRNIKDVGRQMAIQIPSVPAGRQVRAVVTFEVQRLAPTAALPDVKQFRAPDPHAKERKLAVYLAPSPKIESDDPQVGKAAEEAVGDRQGAWEMVEAIHQWVHKNIEFAGDLENVNTCMQTLQLRRGVCAEMNSLTVAMLRAGGFPARLVRIPGHCYYEVYLLDGQGQGHWLAGDASRDATITPGTAAEGVILQKGDNVSLIDPTTKRRTKGRFLAETCVGVAQSSASRMRFQPISPALAAARQKPVAEK